MLNVCLDVGVLVNEFVHIVYWMWIKGSCLLGVYECSRQLHSETVSRHDLVKSTKS